MPVDLAIVPVAGQGTRLLPSTKSQPKEMLPVGRKPVVQYIVEELANSGIRRVLFITGTGKSSIENHFDINAELIDSLRRTGKESLLGELDFERHNIEYFYTRQRRPLGLGHAVLCAQPFVGDQPVVVALGDSIIGINAQSDIVRRMVDEFERSGADAIIAFETVAKEEVVNYGIAKPRDPAAAIFDLQDVVEKPSVAEAPSNLAVTGRYVFKSSVFNYLAEIMAEKPTEVQLTEAIHRMIAKGAKVIGMRLEPHERRYDIGSFESYFRTFVEFALADKDHGEALAKYLRERL